jgi:hypothetical protein
LITAPFVRTAHAAGKLTMGFWDHWVPGANKVCSDLVNEWAEKEKVEVAIDFITSQGNKILVTIAAEAAAQSGHDILAMPTWWPQANSDMLEPVNEIMAPLMQQNGEVNGTVKYLGQSDGKWLGVPATSGSQIKGPCSRIDLMKKFAQGGRLDHRDIPESRRGLPQGRLSLRHRARRDHRLGRYRRRVFPGIWRAARRCQEQRYGQDRRGAAGA